MIQRSMISAATSALVAALVAGAVPANALGLKDCSDKYSAEKAAGSAAGKKNWNDFRKSDCGANAKPLATAAPGAAATAPAPAATTPAKPAAATPAKPAATTPAVKPPVAAAAPTPPAATAITPAAPVKGKKAKAAAAAASAPVSPAVFPAAISDTYKAKKPAKARMATCLDQYRTNKANNANGGLRWIQKGGGYYSQCNKKLKG
jgi:hypothetical protein